MAIISRNVSEALMHLENGEIIGLPTETVYGLAGNAYDINAILKIFETKKRPSFDPLIVHTNSIEKVHGLVKKFPSQALKFGTQNWPGPVTLILPKSNAIPDLVTSGLDTVAVRIPRHSMALDVLAGVNFPLAAPSANPFGYVSPTTAQHVNDFLGDSLSFILDGGQTSIGIESTIIDFTVNKKPTVLRMGGMTLEEIQEQIADVKLKLYQSSNPTAPGMLDSHYAPRKPLVIGNINELIQHHSGKEIGIISWCQKIVGVNPEHQLVLSPDQDLTEASKNLFSALRKIDTMDVDVILAELLPEKHLGRAINDRLRRASQ